MNKRLAQILAAVALAVAGGTALTVALRQEANCSQWEQLATEAQNQEPFEWFVAVADSFSVPGSVGDYVLGNCGAQGCTLNPAGCGATQISYRIERSVSVAGFRGLRLLGPKYFARAWKELAAAQPANVKFWQGWAQAKAACAASFTALQCRQMLSSINSCWKRADGQFCNNGVLYGPGLGGVTCSGNPAVCVPASCSLQAGDVPYPCVSEHGAGWPDRAIVDAFPSDAELEQ